MKILSDKTILNQISKPVTVEEAVNVIKELENALRVCPHGIGLSAIQIGIPKQVFIIKDCDDGNVFHRFVNPVKIECSHPFIFQNEGCLSYPGLYLNTNRFHHYVLKRQIVDGNNFRDETNYFYFPESTDEPVNQAHALMSIAVQHEMDHLSGLILPEYGFSKLQIRDDKAGRNDPCPCGKKNDSGVPLKYKKCCGR